MTLAHSCSITFQLLSRGQNFLETKAMTLRDRAPNASTCHWNRHAPHPFLLASATKKKILGVVRVAEDVRFGDQFLDVRKGLLLLATPRPDFHPSERGDNDAEVGDK